MSVSIKLEAVGERLSHRLIPKITIGKGEYGSLWDVNIKCYIPPIASKEEKSKLKAVLKRKPCHGACFSMTDREAIDKIIALLQSDSINHYEEKVVFIEGKGSQ